jgi:hypothetical protein
VAKERFVDPNENELSMLADALFAEFEKLEDSEGKQLVIMLSDGNEGMLATHGYEDDGGEAFEHIMSHAKAIMKANGGELQIIVQDEPNRG